MHLTRILGLRTQVTSFPVKQISIIPNPKQAGGKKRLVCGPTDVRNNVYTV
jgi:hypothetical protein